MITDSLSGSGGQKNLIDGGTGNDRITITALYNDIKGGAGDDVISHETSNGSNFFVYLFTTIEGGRGADTITLINSNAQVSYASSSKAVVINLATNLIRGGDAKGDVFNDVNSLEGTAKADRLTGNDNANGFDGGGGNDILAGNGGNDRMDGEDGDDTLRGGNDNDTLYGSAGNDRLFGDAGNDELVGGAGADLLNGGDGDADKASYAFSTAGGVMVSLITGRGNGGDATGDRLVGIEDLTGTSFVDRLTGDGQDNSLSGYGGDDLLKGGGGADFLSGSDGSDRILGGTGNDYVNGGDGDDVLIGGKGDDRLVGGEGNDTLKGGGGRADIFNFDLGFFDTSFGDDTIRGFSARNSERIDLSEVGDITSFTDLMADHLETDGSTGFARITSEFGSILLAGYAESDFGAGQAISAADFLF